MKPTHRRLVRSATRSTAQLFELLEMRRLMAATRPVPEALANRVDGHLWAAMEAVPSYLRGEPVPANVQGVAHFSKDGAVQSYIRVESDLAGTLEQLQRLGIKVDASSNAMHVVQAWITPDTLERAADIDGVQWLELPDYAVTNVTSAGDGILNADKVRNRFIADGIDGTGIKVGVMSDGADHRATVGAELPAVTVNPSVPGSGDEGTAMLEIVHDLAPGAQLYFAGPHTSVEMVNSINYMVAQGCKVICDDLGFLGESYFTDTAVAQAAQSAIDAGVSYITSAGNSGSGQHYQANYTQGNSAFGGGTLHRFGVAGQDVDAVNIDKGASFRAFLQWSDPATASANDYDLYLFDGDSFSSLDSSTTVQNGNDHPFEAVSYVNNTGATIHAQIWVVRKTGAASREIELFTYGNSSMQFSTSTDALFGQEAVPDVISVAAAPASSPNNIEAFSSRGGSTIYSNFATQTKSIRQSLDGTAIDGVQTAVGVAGLFYNPFYGTSAASPHAAGIAALVRATNPNLTPQQVAQFMADTATDLSTPGYDVNSGAGRYNALDAVYKAYTPAAVDLYAGSDGGVSQTDNYTDDSTPTLTGTVPLGSAVALIVDGVAQPTLQLGPAENTYNLTSTALADGVHQVSIRVASSGSASGVNASFASTPLAVTIDTTAPTITVPLAFNYDAAVQSLTVTFSEPLGATFDPSMLVVQATVGGPISNASKLATFTGNKLTLTFPGFVHGALPDGNYTASFIAGTPTDKSGHAVANVAPLDFFVLAGDINHDRSVNFDDLIVLAQNYNTSGKTFSQGNIDYSVGGAVNFDDLIILAQKYNTVLAAAPIMAAPSSLIAAPTKNRRKAVDDVLA